MNKNYLLTKSSTFSLQNIQEFLLITSDSDDSLVIKVSLTFGICGAVRVSEIIAINFEGVKINDDGIQIHIRQSKTDQAGVGHSFLISPSAKKTDCFFEIIKAYFTKFPKSMRTGRFLAQIVQLV